MNDPGYVVLRTSRTLTSYSRPSGRSANALVVDIWENALTTLSMDEFQLHRELRGLRQYANDRVFELLAAYDRDAGSAVLPLALEAFDRLIEGTITLNEIAVVTEDQVLSERAINRCARLAAVAVHTHISTRYQAGRLSPMAEDTAFILRAIDRAEARYNSLLLDTRSAAKSGRIERLAAVFANCLDTVAGDVAYAAFALAGQTDAQKSEALAAIRVAHLTRRIAMLSAASVLLMFRLTNSAKAKGLSKVAGNRTTLARSVARMRAAIPNVTGASVGDQVRLQARCLDIEWVEDGDGYTKISVAAGQVSELRLPRRNAQRAGLAKGAWLYLVGSLAQEAGTEFLLVKLLPISANAANIWEDYLISETRTAYDLVPGSIDMLWELPDLREIGGRNELHGRL